MSTMGEKKERSSSESSVRMFWEKTRDSRVGSFLKKCGRLDRKTDNSFFVGLVKRLNIKRKFIKPLKYKIAHAKDESMVFYALSMLGKMLLSLELLNYGTFLLLFAITSFLTEGAQTLITTGSIYNIDYSSAIQMAVMFFASLILVFGGRSRSLAEAIHGSSILSFFIFNLFGVRRELVRGSEKPRSELFWMIISGVALGVVSLWASPTVILTRIFLIVLGILVFNVPESGVVMTFLSAPFLGDKALFILTTYVWVCYILKLVVGKRSFKLTFTDCTVMCFGLITFVTGITGILRHDYTEGLMGAWMVLCFVLVSTLIKNRAWISRSRMSITISTVLYGVLGIVGTLLDYLDRATSMPRDLGVYLADHFPAITKESGMILLLGIFLVFGYTSVIEKNKSRFVMILLSFLMIVGVFLTYSWVLWLAFLIGFAVYAAYTRPRSLYFIVAFVTVIVIILTLIPNTALEQVLNFAGFSNEEITQAMHNNSAILKIAGKNILGGIGLSKDSLEMYLSEYSATLDPDGVNTMLVMMAQTGIFSVAMFVFIFLLVLGSYSVWRKSYKGDKKLLSVGVGGISMLFCIATISNFKYTFENMTSSIMFWMIIGLVYSSCKVMKEEMNNLEEEEEKVFYVEKRVSEVNEDGQFEEAEI